MEAPFWDRDSRFVCYLIKGFKEEAFIEMAEIWTKLCLVLHYGHLHEKRVKTYMKMSCLF